MHGEVVEGKVASVPQVIIGVRVGDRSFKEQSGTYEHWNMTTNTKTTELLITKPPATNTPIFIPDRPGPSNRYSMASMDSFVRFEPRSKSTYVTRLCDGLSGISTQNL